MTTNFFVTGAAGCVGQAFLGGLNPVGTEVVGLDLTPPPVGIRVGTWVRGNVLDAESYDWALRGIEVVIHLAAKAHSVPRTKEEAAEFWKINLDGTRALLGAAVKNGVRRFVHVSTVAVTAPSSVGLTSAYADSKRAAEEEVLGSGDRIEVIIVRPTTVYGPKDRGNVFKLIRWIDRGLPPMIGSGKNRKSLVYSANLAYALLFLSERGKSGEAYVVTDGRDRSMQEIVCEISKCLGRESRFPSVPLGLVKAAAEINERLADLFGLPRFLGRETVEKLIGDTVFDPSLLFSLGFAPAYSFEEGIEETVRWYKGSAR